MAVYVSQCVLCINRGDWGRMRKRQRQCRAWGWNCDRCARLKKDVVMDWCRDWDTSHRHGAVLECRRADLEEETTEYRQAGNWGSIGCLSGWVATRRDSKAVSVWGCEWWTVAGTRNSGVVGIWTRNRFRSILLCRIIRRRSLEKCDGRGS